jgi:hypothetical protein
MTGSDFRVHGEEDLDDGWQRPLDEQLPSDEVTCALAPDVDHSRASDPESDAEALAALQWTISPVGQKWLQATQDEAKEREEAARLRRGAKATLAAASRRLLCKVRRQTHRQLVACAKLIQEVWKFRKHLRAQERICWISVREGQEWISFFLDDCLLHGAHRAHCIHASCSCIQRAIRCHHARGIHCVLKHDRDQRNAAVQLSSNIRATVHQRRFKHLRETLLAVLMRRPFIRAGPSQPPTLLDVMKRIAGRWWMTADWNGVKPRAMEEARGASCRICAALRRAEPRQNFVRLYCVLGQIADEVVREGVGRHVRRLRMSAPQAAADLLSDVAIRGLHQRQHHRAVSSARVLQKHLGAARVRAPALEPCLRMLWTFGEGCRRRVLGDVDDVYDEPWRQAYFAWQRQGAKVLQATARGRLRLRSFLSQRGALACQQVR